jgi:hypothetical protein
MISAPKASTRVRLEHTSPENKARLAPIALGTGGVTFKDQVSGGYPETKGRAGGKLPAGKQAVRSPRPSIWAASWKAATNQEYIP